MGHWPQGNTAEESSMESLLGSYSHTEMLLCCSTILCSASDCKQTTAARSQHRVKPLCMCQSDAQVCTACLDMQLAGRAVQLAGRAVGVCCAGVALEKCRPDLLMSLMSHQAVLFAVLQKNSCHRLLCCIAMLFIFCPNTVNTQLCIAVLHSTLLWSAALLIDEWLWLVNKDMKTLRAVLMMTLNGSHSET